MTPLVPFTMLTLYLLRDTERHYRLDYRESEKRGGEDEGEDTRTQPHRATV
eukprot:COSAG02_NODE_1945_length_10305_cov_5.152165_13_plen_51_part_00